MLSVGVQQYGQPEILRFSIGMQCSYAGNQAQRRHADNITGGRQSSYDEITSNEGTQQCRHNEQTA